LTGSTHPRSSRITIPDYAAGIVDQLENPTTRRKQITFAC
jgi:putative NADH-flavin reductase